jgi:protein ImuB
MLLCVVIPDYPLAVALRDVTNASGEAVLVADKPDRGRVLALDRHAHAAGARVGQTVAQASAAAHGATVLLHDAQHARAVWDDLLDALDAVSPAIDDSEPGVAHLDMRGIDGSPSQWIERVHRALDDFGLPVRVACAENKFVARAAALVADGTLCERGSAWALLEPLPLELLGIESRTIERLHLLDVHTLGELGGLPHGPFVRRFGRDAATWHDRALGIDRTAFVPRGHALAIEATIFGEGGIEAEAHLAFALRILLDRVCGDLERLGKRCGSVRVEMELENGEVSAREVGLARPSADARAMLDVIRANLENVTFVAPVIGLRVRALRLEENGEALGLFAGNEADPQTVAVTLARLEAALGEPARRARTVPAYALEGQFAYDAFTVPAISTLPNRPSEAPVETRPQLHLLAVREITVQVAGGTPAYVGTPRRAVLECAGPWRIEENWFEEPLVRDEYDVLLEDGALYRIYRQGACWYMRGAYD